MMAPSVTVGLTNVSDIRFVSSLIAHLFCGMLLLNGVLSQILREDIVLINRPVVVAAGRSVFVDPVNDLRVRVRPGDTCELTVQDSNDLAYSAGGLTATRFPCNFGPNEMKFVHFAGSVLPEYRIRMLLRYDSATQTIIIPLTIVFRIEFKPLDIVVRRNSISVDQIMGLSSSIDETSLKFRFDHENTICKISILSRARGLPRYGYIVNDTRLLTNIDCDKFLTLGIRYKHHARSNAPNRDYIPIMVDVLTKTGKVLKQEYFQFEVDIKRGHGNTRPEPSGDALFVMDSINQFVMTPITPDIVSAVDEQTPADRLLYNISFPLGPGEGRIVNTDNRNLPISSFFQHQINDLKIAYKPPSSDSNIKRLYQLELTIIDTELMKSDPIPLMIIVEPMNTFAPVVTTNTGIQLVEGQSRPIVSPNVLQISDEDNLKDVRLYHIGGLRHGHLQLPTNKKYFTPADLRTGKVVYQHDDSDTISDNIIFRMTDGSHSVEFLFPVTIYPKDDHAPTLTINTGLELQKNEVVPILQSILSAIDVDSDSATIHFVLEPPYSTEGILIKRQFEIPEDVDNWRFQRGIYEKVVTRFTQKDVEDGKIFYKHIGRHISQVLVDKIRFRLVDGGSPPNKSPINELVIKVQPVDDIPPYLYPNIKLQLEVEESQLLHFRRKNLRYTDDDTNDREIKFIITRPPFDTYDQGPSDAGKLVYCDKPDQPISKFIQSEINHHKICYRPPDMELGIATRIIQFHFDVEDISGNVLTDQRYTIIVKPVNNQPPRVKNAGAAVFENDKIVINSQLLDVEDQDTDDDMIFIIIRRVPMHGGIFKRRKKLDVGDIFTTNDIAQGNIVYQNIGESVEAKEDFITFDVSDGIHFVPITFRIIIRPKDDEPAQFLGQDGRGNRGLHMYVRERESVTFRRDYFQVVDPDTDASQLVYILESYPKYGVVLKSARRTDHFSQKDIMMGHVIYNHTGGEIGQAEIQDSFKLILTENSRAVVDDRNQNVEIHVQISVLPVDNISPTVLIGQNIDVLEGEKTEILPSHLDIQDNDSNDDDILCTIVTQPKFGFIENQAPLVGSEKSRAGMPISAFSIKHLRIGDIFYVQSVHKGIEPRQDGFIVQCTDGINVSPVSRLDIVIHPANDEAPDVHVREFIGSEGMQIRIDRPILSAVDGDEPEDELHFIITRPPSHGRIIQQSRKGDLPVANFSMSDIRTSSTIIYEHDDSETTSDQFEFVLTDGRHNVTKSVPIIIFPVDDETPRLSINNGLEIGTLGDRKLITNKILKAEDLDSFIGNITYIIRKMPQQGYLVKNLKSTSKNLTRGSNFTQLDVDHEVIEYIHTGLEAKRDLIKFDVTDGLNVLIDRYFYITIKGMDTIYPEVINRGVELPQGGVVTLTTDLISGTDLNSPDERLKFTVTRAPHHGYLELASRAGVPITMFTQLDLAGNRVRYVHNIDNEIRMDSFEFEVTDGFNPVSRTFRIAVTDVDNKIPVVMFSSFQLKEGGNKVITPFELKAIDIDTSDDQVVFTVIQVPLHGNLLYNYSRLLSRFSLHDLKQNLVSYQHDGTETFSDSFTFTVTDGTHSQFFVLSSNIPTRRPQEIDIEIIAVDNGIPQISVNKGGTSLSPLGDRIGYQLTSRVLQADDLDSPVDSLTFTLTVPPKHGYIRHIDHSKAAVTTWTQGDIDRGHIQYILNRGEDATSDSFFFKVADKGGNVLANQPFHLKWGWITFRQSHMTVNETEGALVVTLRRRGHLGETCFVTVNVTERTATMGRDVSRQFAQQVQFNPGQTEKTWQLPIRDDNMFEREESVTLTLTDPVSVVLEEPMVATVSIIDPEDESIVFFPEVLYKVVENVSRVDIPIYRMGDLSQPCYVLCHTHEQQGSATGTPPDRVVSFSDYISRPKDQTSMVMFDMDQDKAYCTINVIDDSLYEVNEQFKVILSEPSGGRLGAQREATVWILVDPADEPSFYFDAAEYNVDESAGTLEVKVWKTGTDLSRPSSVTVQSRMSDTHPAQAGHDYISMMRILDFQPHEMSKLLHVTILDDLSQPVLEGPEMFELHLHMPVGGTVGQPSVTVVTINDSLSDMPKMEFADAEYEVIEKEEEVVALIARSGDLNHESRVRCYTRQASAKVEVDFIERPNTNASFVTFKPGAREAECRVPIVNDEIHEGEESFRLVLGTPDSITSGGATVGGQNSARVVILDPEDRPVIKFEMSHYTVNEPIIRGDVTVLRVPVIRIGDTSGTSEVRVSTKSGSATAGRDFNGYSRALQFGPGIERMYAEIEINFDRDRENNEMFSLHLSQDRHMIAEVQHNRRATIYIEENSKLADVIFPVPPIVVSLRDLDNVREAMNFNPIQGYPLICVSPCSPKHPRYSDVSRLCTADGMNDTLTKYRWRIGPPGDGEGVRGELRNLEANTVFTNTRYITLDSIYFGRGSRVQCLARAVNEQGQPGKELGSPVVTVHGTEGLCPPRRPDSVGADPFTARLRYTGPNDPHHPNTVRLTVQVPHTDGMFPVISTKRLSNFDLAISPDGFRLGQHRCSNLLDVAEIPTSYGFITNQTRRSRYHSEVEPFQFSADFRPKQTLRFYRNLDLDSCLWTFEAYYGVSELVSECGGLVETDGQVLNVKQSYVSLRVPLYVSYLYRSTLPSHLWRNYDMSTYMNLRFVYDTSILWQDGIRSTQGDDGNVQGDLYPSSMRIEDDGRLVVNFKTKAHFRGQFVKSYPGGKFISGVESPDHRNLRFILGVTQSDATYDQPEQTWEFISNMAIKDYSGDYKISLVPCTVTLTQSYSQPIICSPSDPVTFDLPIRFQQVSDPVPARFSLNTEFRLLRKRELWLADRYQEMGTDADSVFAPGDMIYGRVDVDPVQSLGNQFSLDIEKVFLCSGKDGYIPKYDPENGEYGCITETGYLDKVFRILDKEAPHTVSDSYDGVKFKATLAADDKSARDLVVLPGADGFSMDSSPLFKVDSGTQWFLHTIYSLRSRHDSHSIVGRSISSHHLIRRTVKDSQGVGEGGKGTNMVALILDINGESYDQNEDTYQSDKVSEQGAGPMSMIAILVGVGILLLICIFVLVICIRHRRKRTSPPPTPSGTITVMSGGQTRVVSNAHLLKSGDNTEV